MNTVLERVAPVAAPVVVSKEAAKAVKCVVWDLDHTLWEGILSEGDDLVLKPGIVDLLATLDARGILLSVASKNNRDDAMRQLERFGIAHYFLYPQIGWGAKSAGVARIREDLNIGIDTFLFVDDQPFERDEVQAVHAEVRCIDALRYAELLDLPELNPAVITEDASRRRLMYLEDIARRRDEDDYAGTPDEFLATLAMRMTIAPARPADLVRAEELTLRTNQLNSTGITYDHDDLAGYMRSARHQLLICELEDKYGSYGKIGLALIERDDDEDRIKLLLMSCRTVSRGAGSVLLTHLIRQAAIDGKRLRADFRRTERNRQMLVTYQFARFVEVSRSGEADYVFENDLTVVPEFPSFIDVRVETD